MEQQSSLPQRTFCAGVRQSLPSKHGPWRNQELLASGTYYKEKGEWGSGCQGRMPMGGEDGLCEVHGELE